jgi:hypothetical protein
MDGEGKILLVPYEDDSIFLVPVSAILSGKRLFSSVDG